MQYSKDGAASHQFFSTSVQLSVLFSKIKYINPKLIKNISIIYLHIEFVFFFQLSKFKKAQRRPLAWLFLHHHNLFRQVNRQWLHVCLQHSLVI